MTRSPVARHAGSSRTSALVMDCTRDHPPIAVLLIGVAESLAGRRRVTR